MKNAAYAAVSLLAALVAVLMWRHWLTGDRMTGAEGDELWMAASLTAVFVGALILGGYSIRGIIRGQAAD